MSDNATEFAVESLDPEDPEADLPASQAVPPLSELPLDAAADEGDAVEQSREVPVDEDEYR
ncbi:hypothetical protein P3T36_001189 [Kitasatospora sp. MAP12-15]|uniref:hypothetical protein n=1 Tax=unclassified Kitasatospora TaxID=2633591 RepID=UPI00247492CB|nr:hypothetical protein [Kitasatospora sp. MAP12-44]MDH6114838.1 hypothetical protein [Kitasatospora sp. MAP12-44]